jgi:hypothetical protein
MESARASSDLSCMLAESSIWHAGMESILACQGQGIISSGEMGTQHHCNLSLLNPCPADIIRDWDVELWDDGADFDFFSCTAAVLILFSLFEMVVLRCDHPSG